MNDRFYMSLALDLAIQAQRSGERPFGCVVVDEAGEPIGTGRGSERHDDPTCHSEMVAIRQACARRDGLLRGCAIYSTHEPCVMCIGAINHAKLSRVVFGSWRHDLPLLFRRRDCTGLALLADTSCPPTVVHGVMRDDCVSLFAEERASERTRIERE